MNSLSHLVEALFQNTFKMSLDRKPEIKKSPNPIPTVSGKQRRKTNKHLSFLKAAFAVVTGLEKDLIWVWAENVPCFRQGPQCLRNYSCIFLGQRGKGESFGFVFFFWAGGEGGRHLQLSKKKYFPSVARYFSMYLVPVSSSAVVLAAPFEPLPSWFCPQEQKHPGSLHA